MRPSFAPTGFLRERGNTVLEKKEGRRRKRRIRRRRRRGKSSWICLQFSSVQSLSHVQLFATPWNAAHQASRYTTDSWSLLKLMSIESVMASNHLILCRPILLPPSIFPSIRVFSNESALRIRWFNISLTNEHPGLISLGWTGWISLQSKGLSSVFSSTTVQKHQFFSTRPTSQSNSHIHTWPQEKP